MAARAAIGLRERTSDPVEKQEWEHELMLRVKALTGPGLPPMLHCPRRSEPQEPGSHSAETRLRARTVCGGVAAHLGADTFKLAPDSWDR
jgi:hypothetical protein